MVSIIEKYGKLTVNNKESCNGKTFALCTCECGNTKRVRLDQLKDMKYPSCGCERPKIYADTVRTNKINKYANSNLGSIYNYLTILSFIPDAEHCSYLCKCICGNETIVRFDHLKSGKTKSCGCKRIEILRELNKKEFGLSSFNELLNSYKQSAKKRDILFELDNEQFKKITSQDCFYCGLPPNNKINNIKNNGHYIHNGIDRMNSNIGYNIDNCVPCCSKCNYMKRSYTVEEFKEHIERLYLNFVQSR